jgi:hypothetical protein|tara:strand:+ start:203 stop:634 length:432 start_codon:yes stop_codon:yes gene_type:complete
MAHYRQQIRERIVTTLTGLPVTGSNVFDSRVYTIEESKLPCLCVYTTSETSSPITMNPPRTVEKLLEVKVEIYCKSTQYATDLEEIAKNVKEAMYGDRLINNLAKDSYLTGEEINYNGEGDANVSTATLTFEVHYHHEEGVLD